LRSAYTDAARQLSSFARATLAIEAGEHQWRLRRQKQLVGKIDWAAAEPKTGRRLLRELAGKTGKAATILVEIPPERVLSRIVALPAGARGEIDRILSFEIARHFPFPAERVFYRYRRLDRSGNSAAARDGPLAVELVAVPRDVVASIVDELAVAGLQVSGIAMVASPDAAPLFLPREALAGAAAPPAISRRIAALFVLLALIAAVSWPLAQQVRLAALQRDIAALRPQAEAALRARQTRQRESEQAAAIAQLRAGRPPLVALLDTLSRELPDGSWLTSLSLAGHDMLIEGLSPSATTIALALGRNPNFGNVQFRAPTARDVATGLEHFQFGATIEEVRR